MPMKIASECGSPSSWTTAQAKTAIPSGGAVLIYLGNIQQIFLPLCHRPRDREEKMIPDLVELTVSRSTNSGALITITQKSLQHNE